jgi:hypothetical protein
MSFCSISPRTRRRSCMESSVRSGNAPDCPARAFTTPGHSAVTISPRVAMDSGDCIPFGRGLVARLIGPARGCSTAAAPAATAVGMLHGGDEPQHAGNPQGSILLDRCTGKTGLLLCNDTPAVHFDGLRYRTRPSRPVDSSAASRLPDAPFALVSGGCQKFRK